MNSGARSGSRHLQLACTDNKAHVGVCFVSCKRQLFKIKTAHCSFRLGSCSLSPLPVPSPLFPSHHPSNPLQLSALLQHFPHELLWVFLSTVSLLCSCFQITFCSCRFFRVPCNKMFMSGCGCCLEQKGFRRAGDGGNCHLLCKHKEVQIACFYSLNHRSRQLQLMVMRALLNNSNLKLNFHFKWSALMV